MKEQNEAVVFKGKTITREELGLKNRYVKKSIWGRKKIQTCIFLWKEEKKSTPLTSFFSQTRRIVTHNKWKENALYPESTKKNSSAQKGLKSFTNSPLV